MIFSRRKVILTLKISTLFDMCCSFNHFKNLTDVFYFNENIFLSLICSKINHSICLRKNNVFIKRI